MSFLTSFSFLLLCNIQLVGNWWFCDSDNDYGEAFFSDSLCILIHQNNLEYPAYFNYIIKDDSSYFFHVSNSKLDFKTKIYLNSNQTLLLELRYDSDDNPNQLYLTKMEEYVNTKRLFNIKWGWYYRKYTKDFYLRKAKRNCP